MSSRMSSRSVANHTGPRILESPLKHCDPAQRATTRQPGATPQVLSIAMRFALEGLHQTALWNPFRVRVRMVREPGATFIRIRGFSCPMLICASLSGSIKASSKYNSFVARARPRTSFREEPDFAVWRSPPNRPVGHLLPRIGGRRESWNDGARRIRDVFRWGLGIICNCLTGLAVRFDRTSIVRCRRISHRCLSDWGSQRNSGWTVL